MTTTLGTTFNATSFTVIDLSSVVTTGNTHAVIQIKNNSDQPLDLHFRKNGGSEQAPRQVLPQTSNFIVVPLDSNYKFEYYVSNDSVSLWFVQGYSQADLSSTAVVPSGTATVWDLVDISAVTSELAALISVQNTGGTPLNFTYRKATGQTEHTVAILSGQTENIYMDIASNHTFQYKLNNGTVTIYVVSATTTAATYLTTISEIRSPYLIDYSESDISDRDLTKILADISKEVTKAASLYLAIRGYAVDADIKALATKIGTAWMALMVLHNKGVQRGLEAQSPRVSLQTAKDYQDKYINMLTKMKAGFD